MEFTNFLKAIDKYCLNNDLKSVHVVLTELLSEEEIVGVYEYGVRSYAPNKLIYYYQTRDFFNEYYDDIFEMINSIIDEYGINYFEKFTFHQYDLTVLYVENVVNDFISYCEFNDFIK